MGSGSGLRKLLVAGAVVAGVRHYAKDDDPPPARPPVSRPAARPAPPQCYVELTAQPSAYEQAMSVFRGKRGGEDYVHCVLEQVCRHKPTDPRPYFFKTLHSRRNTCYAAERRHRDRFKYVEPWERAQRDTALDTLIVGRCYGELPPREQEAVAAGVDYAKQVEFRRRHGLSEIAARKAISRANQKFGACLIRHGHEGAPARRH